MGGHFFLLKGEDLRQKAAEIWEAGKTNPDEPKPVMGWRGRLCRWIVGETVYTKPKFVTVSWLDGCGRRTERDGK